MSENIYINSEAVENDANQIVSAASYFMMDALVPTDGATTLTANAAGQQAYALSQQVIAVLGENLDREVTNIRSIEIAFTQYDSMMAALIANGSRYPVLTSMD